MRTQVRRDIIAFRSRKQTSTSGLNPPSRQTLSSQLASLPTTSKFTAPSSDIQEPAHWPANSHVSHASDHLWSAKRSRWKKTQMLFVSQLLPRHLGNGLLAVAEEGVSRWDESDCELPGIVLSRVTSVLSRFLGLLWCLCVGSRMGRWLVWTTW